MSTRVMAFIDGSNLFYSTKDENFRMDFSLLRTFLADPAIYGEKVRFIRSYYYGSTTGHLSQEAFFQKLMAMGYDTRTVALKHKAGKLVEKGVDVWLAVDMVNFAARGQYDIAVLLSGDSDYLPACRIVKDWGKTLVLATFGQSCSQELRLVADLFIDLKPRIPELKL